MINWKEILEYKAKLISSLYEKGRPHRRKELEQSVYRILQCQILEVLSIVLADLSHSLRDFEKANRQESADAICSEIDRIERRINTIEEATSATPPLREGSLRETVSSC